MLSGTPRFRTAHIEGLRVQPPEALVEVLGSGCGVALAFDELADGFGDAVAVGFGLAVVFVGLGDADLVLVAFAVEPELVPDPDPEMGPQNTLAGSTWRLARGAPGSSGEQAFAASA